MPLPLLNNPPGSVGPSRPRRARYDERVKRPLVTLWTTANRICAKRLVLFLPELIEVMERNGRLSLPADVRGKLLTISSATADRLLASERSSRHGLSTTRPGSLLKKQIKVRTFADWDDLQPGFLEADLVAHCGESAAGSFLHTLVLVDIATGWTECVALLRRSEADVIGALNSLRGRLPVPLLGLDTDNGSEFINYEMLSYCQREQITFTRSRVNRKNDRAFVEEKNGSIVRRLIGYDRYEGLGAWRALIQLYEILRLYVNFFQPSMKLIEKQRDGARVKKRYDRAQTPYQRVIASAYLTKRKREVDEMAEIATEAIEPPDDDHVSLPRRLEEGGEPRAVLTLSGRLVLVDRVVADAGLAQSIPLQVEALGTVRLRYPRVADQHWRLQNDRFCDT